MVGDSSATSVEHRRVYYTQQQNLPILGIHILFTSYNFKCFVLVYSKSRHSTTREVHLQAVIK